MSRKSTEPRKLSTLQETLSDCIDRLLDDDLPTDVAKGIASLASVKIAGERVKLRYHVTRKETPKSEFLEG